MASSLSFFSKTLAYASSHQPSNNLSHSYGSREHNLAAPNKINGQTIEPLQRILLHPWDDFQPSNVPSNRTDSLVHKTWGNCVEPYRVAWECLWNMKSLWLICLTISNYNAIELRFHTEFGCGSSVSHFMHIIVIPFGGPTWKILIVNDIQFAVFEMFAVNVQTIAQTQFTFEQICVIFAPTYDWTKREYFIFSFECVDIDELNLHFRGFETFTFRCGSI